MERLCWQALGLIDDFELQLTMLQCLKHDYYFWTGNTQCMEIHQIQVKPNSYVFLAQGLTTSSYMTTRFKAEPLPMCKQVL